MATKKTNTPTFDNRNSCISYLESDCGFSRRKELRGMPFGKLQDLALFHWNDRNNDRN